MENYQGEEHRQDVIAKRPQAGVVLRRGSTREETARAVVYHPKERLPEQDTVRVGGHYLARTARWAGGLRGHKDLKH